MVRKLFKNVLWIFFLIMMIILIPSSFSLHAQTEDRSIVIAMGIDKTESDQYEVSIEFVVPRYATTYNQNAQVISAVGVNTTDAFVGLSLHVGRIIGLSHCSTILIGESLNGEDIIEIIDQVLRGKRVNYNAQLIYAQGSAKEILQKAIEIDVGYNLNINEIVQFNDLFINAKTLLLSDFYKTYYQGYGASFMPVLSLSEKDSDGISPNSSSSGSSSQGQNASSSQGESGGQGSQSNQKKYFSNDGKTAIFNKGKFVKLLLPNEVTGFGLMTNESTRGAVALDNVTNKYFTNAQITFSIRDRNVTREVKFSKTGKPQIYYTINYRLRIEQIKNGIFNKNVVSDTKDFFTPELKSMFSDKVKNESSKAIQMAKELKLDLFDLFDEFNKFKYTEWQDYLKGLENREEYIDDVEFFMKVNVFDAN